MLKEVVGKCPVCGESLEVTELQCPSCHTRLSGRFELCKFCKLPPEQRAFAEIFIKNRGNIREVERELGVSYPTVRSRLEALIRALGYPIDQGAETSDDAGYFRQRKEIIDKLARGEVSPQEAARMLKNLASKQTFQ